MRIAALSLVVLMLGCGGGVSPGVQEPAPPEWVAERTMEITHSGIAGPEGRHSASHSGVRQTGRLAIAAREARLELTQTSWVGHVLCRPGDPGIVEHTRQACHETVPPEVTPSRHEYVMRGTITDEPGGFSLDLTYRDGSGSDRRTRVVCHEGGPHDGWLVDCEVDRAWPNPIVHGFHRPTLRFGAR